MRNGSHVCTSVLMNICNITFQVLRLITFVFNKCSQNKMVTIIFVVKNIKSFGWDNVGPASQKVAQHNISIGLIYRVIWCFWRRNVKASPAYAMTGQRRRLWVNIETALVECHVFTQSIQQTR